MNTAARRRRSTVIALASGLVVLALLPLSAIVAWRAVRDSRAAEAVVALPTVAIPNTPTAILGVTDDQNYLTAVAILSLSSSGAGGTAMIVPAGIAITGQPEGEPRRLADVYGAEGAESMKVALESITSTQIDMVSVNGYAGTGDLIARAGTITVTFAGDVVDEEAGESRTVAIAGPNDFTPLEAADVLAARISTQPEADRLANVRALWDGLATTVGAGKIGTTPAPVIPEFGVQVPVDMPSFMSAFFAGPLRVWQISSQRFGSDTNPDDIDVYGYNIGEVVMVMASVAPSAMVASLPTISLQVDSPYDDPTITSEAVLRLIYMGANVGLVRTISDPPPADTIIRYSDPAERGLAEPLTVLLGDIAWQDATERVAGIDLQVTLGDSFVAFLEQTAQMSLADVAAAAVSTSTSAAPSTSVTP